MSMFRSITYSVYCGNANCAAVEDCHRRSTQQEAEKYFRSRGWWISRGKWQYPACRQTEKGQ